MHACDAMRVWYCHAIARGICVRHPSDIQTDSHREDRQSQAELSLSLAGSLPRCRNPTLPHSAPLCPTHTGMQTAGTPRRVSTMQEPHCDH